MFVLQVDESREISALVLDDEVEDLVEIVASHRPAAFDASQGGHVMENGLAGRVESANRGAERGYDDRRIRAADTEAPARPIVSTAPGSAAHI